MKSELSVMDLHFLVDEFQALIGGKIDQIYQKAKEEFIIRFHIPNVGKKILRIVPGGLIYLASEKGQMPVKPPGFCVYLRKYLKNARIRAIRQIGSERIVELDLETKDQRYKFIVELFSKGNVILTDDSFMIHSAMEQQVWSDRTIKPKFQYKYPAKEYHIFALTEAQLKRLIRESEKESIVKTLASDLGIGGLYAEELCLEAGIDKTKPAKDLAATEIKSLFKAVKDMIQRKSQPRHIMCKDEIKDIVPIILKKYKDFESRGFPSFNKSLDDFFTAHEEKRTKAAAEKKITVKLGKFERMMAEQEKRIKGLERSIEENKKKGELIYENYTGLSALLKKIDELRKKHSWKDVKEILKDNKMVKSIDEKTGEITLEI